MIRLYNTFDMNLVKSIITDDEIWDQITEDGTKKEEYNPCFDSGMIWLLVKFNEDVAGVIYVNKETICSISIHPNLKNKYRMHYKDMMNELFKWFLSLPEEVQKINCSIPVNLKKVNNSALKIGFKSEGVNRYSFLKNNEIYDRIMYGLTRSEVKALCKL